MYDTILVPTDGSDHSVRAAEHASYLASLFDATVHVLSVCETEDEPGELDDEREALEAEAEVAVDTIVGVIGDDVEVETAVTFGQPGEAILEYADDTDVSLVAMGTHGRTGVSRYVTGSVAETVVRHATVPVLTVRSTERSRVGGSYGDVLVPTDGSEHADAAVEHALAIAGRTGARVHAVHVVDVATLSATPEYSVPTAILEDLLKAGETAVNDISRRAREAGLEATTAVRQGSPGRELLAYAEENDVDAVVMGTAGRSGIERFLLGSTTERLIRHADVPVVAVHADGRAGE